MTSAPSVRSQIVARRSYHRPLDMQDPTSPYESWPDVIDRVISHQEWLWERAKGNPLSSSERAELSELSDLMLSRAALVSGRTLWMGGTDTSRRRESTMFNCAGIEVQTVHDMVDFFWLQLQGCGICGKPVTGTLHGFTTPIKNVLVIPTDPSIPDEDRLEHNKEFYQTGGGPNGGGNWVIEIGDSAEAWAKALGKLLSGKHRGCDGLVLDMSNIRKAGKRLNGYGWICHGYKPLADAFTKIVGIMNASAGQLLTRANFHNILNLLGTVLSTRRAAQMILCDASDDDYQQFCFFKKDMYDNGQPWKEQSNNSVDWWDRPTLSQIFQQLTWMADAGGSEPGIRNARAARHRAPWSRTTNPCAEILLPNRGFCNLVEIDLAHPLFSEGEDARLKLHNATYLIARANYRQTCVDLNDGILQRSWHENNENLRLCGVGLTGIARRPDLGPLDFRILRNWAKTGVDAMADELNLPRSRAVTTVKPSGTLSKVMDTTEGFHHALGHYLFNWIAFGVHDPMLQPLRDAGYEVMEHPTQAAFLCKIPVDTGYDPPFETAIEQLDRYAMLMENWCDHNVSCTIYYDSPELPDIAEWLHKNWDRYVAVSFLPRSDPAALADKVRSGVYKYLPQMVCTKEEYDSYVATLRPVDFGALGMVHGDPSDTKDCAGGACPIN